MTLTPLKTSDISVIIPTLNEEGNINSLAEQLSNNVGEIVIIDGGSTDKTVSKANACGIQTIIFPAVRGTRLNLGAAASTGRVLLFLHADTRLPDNFGTDVVNLLNAENNAVGAFSLAINSPTLPLKVIAFTANLRSKFLGLPYGDQAFFLTRTFFDALGGYSRDEIMEDYIFIRQARKKGIVVTLARKVTTSSRRWQRLGVFCTTTINLLMILGYLAGIPTSRLASFYRRRILR